MEKVTERVYIMNKKIEKSEYKMECIEKVLIRKRGVYEKYIKRILDVICAIATIIIFCPLYLFIAILVKIKLGSPIIFTQYRPGLIDKNGRETLFKLYKFRTMTDKKDNNGNLLPDSDRLTPFGSWLRKTSLDEIPEAFNILNGTMSIVGPRPQLVKDMIFMTKEQRMRHTAKPGLSGLAQVNGRNAISWEDKFKWDIKYIYNISLFEDIKIILLTIKTAFFKQEGIVQANLATAEDYGDYLLRIGKVEQNDYKQKQQKALRIINRVIDEKVKDLVSIIMPSYNTAYYVNESIKSVLNQTYTKWELIIVDDCSTDKTDEVLSKIKDKRIKIYKNEKKMGAAISRNRALREAKGQWIAFLDSDDLWESNKLEHQINFMKKNGYYFSYTNYEEIDIDSNKTGVKVTGPKRITRNGMYNYCWPGCLTVMYDSEVIGLVQISDIKKNNDYAMWLKACKKADCYLLDEYLGQYRRGREGSVSNHSISTLIKWHYKLYREAEGKTVISSLIFTCRNLLYGLYKKKKYVFSREIEK